MLHDSIYNEMSRRGKSIERESRLVVAPGWGGNGRQEWEVIIKGLGFLYGMKKKS